MVREVDDIKAGDVGRQEPPGLLQQRRAARVQDVVVERRPLEEARGDVVDVGADDADAAMPPVPVPVKPEAISIE